MNKEQLQEAINNAKHNIELWTKELEEPETKRWYPKVGEEFFYIHINGEIFINTRRESSLFEIDPFNRYLLQFIFQTEEEAKKERNRRLAEVELLDMCDDGVHWICLDTRDNTWKPNHFEDGDRIVNTSYRFATEESAQKAIDTLGVEKLKLIFRIED